MTTSPPRPSGMACFVLALVFAMAAPAPRAGPPAADPGAKFVTALNMGFATLLYYGRRALVRDRRYALLQSEVGKDDAWLAIEPYLRARVPAYQVRWNHTLGTVYLDHLEPAELESIARDKNKSPYFKKFLSVQRALPGNVDRQAGPLLGELTDDVFQRVLADLHRGTRAGSGKGAAPAAASSTM